MRSIILFFFTHILTFSTLGQNSIFKGKILYQNSGKKPAVGVKIIGQGASPDYSTESGQFMLKYSDKIPGAEAGLTIGVQDKFNNYIELVNVAEVKNARLPAEPNNDFYIIVCKAGELADAQKHYYNIAETKLKKDYKKKLEENKQLIVLAANNVKERLRLEDENDDINTRYKISLRKIEEQAAFIAAINKDFASELVKAAIDKIEKNQDIEGALEILDDTKLEEAYQSGLLEKSIGEMKIKKAVEGYELKISLLLPEFRYKEAIKCYEKIIRICETNKFDSQKIAIIYNEMAAILRDNGDNLKALEFQKKAIAMFELIMPPTDTLLPIAYSNLAITYQNLTKLDTAIFYQKKALNIFEKIADSNSHFCATTLNGIAISYEKTGKYLLGFEYVKKAISIYEGANDTLNLNLATYYNTLGAIFIEMRNANALDSGLRYLRKGLTIREKKLDQNNPDLAISYANIASTYQYSNRDSIALVYYKKSIKILESVLDPMHPYIATLYTNIGGSYCKLHVFDTALNFLLKGLKIREAGFDSNNAIIANSYHGIALLFKQERKFDLALEYQKKALKIIEVGLDSFNTGNAIYFRNASEICCSLKKYNKAVLYQQAAIDIYNKSYSNKQSDYILPQLITSYNDCGFYYYLDKKFENAILNYSRALHFDSSGTFIKPIYSNIGLAYAKNGQFKDAEFAFKKYELQNVDIGRAHRNWCAFFALKNDLEKAIEHLQKAISSGYRDMVWITTDESLESIRNDGRYRKLIEQLSAEK